MLVKNAKLRKKDGLYDITVSGGKFEKIVPAGEGGADPETIDAAGKLVIPPYCDSHVHLDYAMTAGVPHHNLSGTLFEGIQIWAEHKEQVPLTREYMRENAKKTLDMMMSYGVQHVRSHVDTGDEKMLGVNTLLELKEEYKDKVDIQLVAFPQDGIYTYKKGAELLEEAVKLGCDCVGGIPHFEYTREYGVKSVEKTFELAEKYDRLIDIHCDEIDDEASRFLEVAATLAYESGLTDKVTASHTVAMHSYNNAYCMKLFNILKKSKINFAVCPHENTHLQGRADAYPKRRGVTRVKELLDAGLNVSFGQDSISDPWYPLGTGNMLWVLEFGLHVCHYMGYDEISNSLDLITENGAKTMHLTDRYGISEGKPADFLIIDAENDFEAVQYLKDVLYSVKNGKVIMKRAPAVVTLY